ncbi:MAG: OmpA family protein, partial [Prevotella sp.]|nr:OmpA family protein [Prevotella sp.]
MKKLLILMCGLWLTTPMNAQFLNRLIDAAKKSAEDAIEQQVNKKVEEGIDKAFNPEVPEKEQQEQQQQEEAEPQQQAVQRQPQAQAPTPASTKTLESAYAKSDFVPGDEIMFEDDLVGEQMGEFPSKWDLLEGNAEIASVNGKTVISLTDISTEIMPLM